MRRGSIRFRMVALLVTGCFLLTLMYADVLRLSSTHASLPGLPAPTQLVTVSAPGALPVLRGLQFQNDDPFSIDFIVDAGAADTVTEETVSCLIRYFLAGLTLPQEHLWVNLSPYEQDRVLADGMETTELGRDLLAQDYFLKQLASSLTHPDTPAGKTYWRMKGEGGDDFSKVWIVPGKAEVYEKDRTVIINDASLKVMTERDYVAQKHNLSPLARANEANDPPSGMNALLPLIEKDVNQGRNFATLRQIYHSLILASWFKTKLKDSLYAAYIDQQKLTGIDVSDPELKEKIYDLYVQSFRKGVYDVIRRDTAAIGEGTSGPAPRRRFFSGGVGLATLSSAITRGAAPRLASSTLERVRTHMQTEDAKAQGFFKYKPDYQSALRSIGVGVDGQRSDTTAVLAALTKLLANFWDIKVLATSRIRDALRERDTDMYEQIIRYLHDEPDLVGGLVRELVRLSGAQGVDDATVAAIQEQMLPVVYFLFLRAFGVNSVRLNHSPYHLFCSVPLDNDGTVLVLDPVYDIVRKIRFSEYYQREGRIWRLTSQVEAELSQLNEWKTGFESGVRTYRDEERTGILVNTLYRVIGEHPSRLIRDIPAEVFAAVLERTGKSSDIVYPQNGFEAWLHRGDEIKAIADAHWKSVQAGDGRWLWGTYRGLYARALNCYREAGKINPASADLNVREADVLRRLGKMAESAEALIQAYRLEPFTLTAEDCLFVAQYYHQSKSMRDNARQWFERALFLKPSLVQEVEIPQVYREAAPRQTKAVTLYVRKDRRERPWNTVRKTDDIHATERDTSFDAVRRRIESQGTEKNVPPVFIPQRDVFPRDPVAVEQTVAPGDKQSVFRQIEREREAFKGELGKAVRDKGIASLSPQQISLVAEIANDIEHLTVPVQGGDGIFRDEAGAIQDKVRQLGNWPDIFEMIGTFIAADRSSCRKANQGISSKLSDAALMRKEQRDTRNRLGLLQEKWQMATRLIDNILKALSIGGDRAEKLSLQTLRPELKLSGEEYLSDKATRVLTAGESFGLPHESTFRASPRVPGTYWDGRQWLDAPDEKRYFQDVTHAYFAAGSMEEREAVWARMERDSAQYGVQWVRVSLQGREHLGLLIRNRRELPPGYATRALGDDVFTYGRIFGLQRFGAQARIHDIAAQLTAQLSQIGAGMNTDAIRKLAVAMAVRIYSSREMTGEAADLKHFVAETLSAMAQNGELTAVEFDVARWMAEQLTDALLTDADIRRSLHEGQTMAATVVDKMFLWAMDEGPQAGSIRMNMITDWLDAWQDGDRVSLASLVEQPDVMSERVENLTQLIGVLNLNIRDDEQRRLELEEMQRLRERLPELESMLNTAGTRDGLTGLINAARFGELMHGHMGKVIKHILHREQGSVEDKLAKIERQLQPVTKKDGKRSVIDDLYKKDTIRTIVERILPATISAREIVKIFSDIIDQEISAPAGKDGMPQNAAYKYAAIIDKILTSSCSRPLKEYLVADLWGRIDHRTVETLRGDDGFIQRIADTRSLDDSAKRRLIARIQGNEDVSEVDPAGLSLSAGDKLVLCDLLLRDVVLQNMDDVKGVVAQAAENGDELTLLFFDIDHFKRLNDTLGHPTGDAVLKEMGTLLHSLEIKYPGRFIASRVGGEEFVVILPKTGKDTAVRMAEELRLSVEHHIFHSSSNEPLVREDEFTGKKTGMVTVSIGVSAFDDKVVPSLKKDAEPKEYPKVDSPSRFYREADDMLYVSKGIGRNCVTYLEKDTGRVVSRRGDTVLGLAGEPMGKIKSDWTLQRVEQELFRPMQAATQKLDQMIVRYNQAGQTFAGRLFRSIMLQNEVIVTDAVAKLVEQAEGTGLSRELYPAGWEEVRQAFRSCREGARKLLYGRDERRNRGRRTTDHPFSGQAGQPQQISAEEKSLLATALQGAEDIAGAFIKEVNRSQDKLRDPPPYLLEWENRLSRIGADLDTFAPESESRNEYEREVLKRSRYAINWALDHYRSMINAIRDGTDIGPLAGMAGASADSSTREYERARLMWDTLWQESVIVDLEQGITALLEKYKTDDIDSPGLFTYTAEELEQEKQELYTRMVRYDALTDTETATGRLKLIANQLPDLTKEYVTRVSELIPYVPDPYGLRIMMQKNELYDPAVRELKQLETRIFPLYSRLFTVMDVMYHLNLINETRYEEVVTIVFSDLFRALTKLHGELHGRSNADGVAELSETELVRYEMEFLRYYATMCWIRDTSVQIYGCKALKQFIDKRLNALRNDINQWLSSPREIKAEPTNALPAMVYTVKGTGMFDVTGLSRALVYDVNDILGSSEQYERIGLMMDMVPLSIELDSLLNRHDFGLAWLDHPQASDMSLHASDATGSAYLPIHTAHKDFYAVLYKTHVVIEAWLSAFMRPSAVENAAREWSYSVFTAGLGTLIDPAFREALLAGTLSREQLLDTVREYMKTVARFVYEFQQANRSLADDPDYQVDIDALSPDQFLRALGRDIFTGDKLTQFLNNHPPSVQLRLLNEQLAKKGKPLIDSRPVESMWFPVIAPEIREFKHFYGRRFIHLLGASKNYPHQANLLLQRLNSGLITADQVDIIHAMMQDQQKLAGARTQALNVPLAFELLERMDLYSLVKTFGEIIPGLKPETIADVNEDLQTFKTGPLKLPLDPKEPLKVLKNVPAGEQKRIIAGNRDIVDKVAHGLGYDALYKMAARSAGLNPDYDPPVEDINRKLAAAGYRHSLRPYTDVSDRGLTIEVLQMPGSAGEEPDSAVERIDDSMESLPDPERESMRSERAQFYATLIPELREGRVRWFRRDGKEVTNNPVLTGLLSGSDIGVSELVDGLSMLLQPGDEFDVEGEGTMRYVEGGDVLVFELVADAEISQDVTVPEQVFDSGEPEDTPVPVAEAETAIMEPLEGPDDSNDSEDMSGFMKDMIDGFEFDIAGDDQSASSALIYDGDADHSLTPAEREMVQKTRTRHKRIAGGTGGLAVLTALIALAHFVPIGWDAVVPVKISVTLEQSHVSDTAPAVDDTDEYAVIPDTTPDTAVTSQADTQTFVPDEPVEPEKHVEPVEPVSRPAPAVRTVRNVSGMELLNLPAMRAIRSELFPGMSDSDIIDLLQGISVPENIMPAELRKKLYGSSALQARLERKGGIDLEHIAAQVQGSSSALVFNDLLPADFKGFTFSVVSRERIAADALLAALR